MLHALIPLAHVETYVRLRSHGRLPTRLNAHFCYFGRRDVRKEIDQAADRLMAGAAGHATHPLLAVGAPGVRLRLPRPGCARAGPPAPGTLRRRGDLAVGPLQ